MKAYQVFECGMNKHDFPYTNLVATYLDYDKAIKHGREIALKEAGNDELTLNNSTASKDVYWTVKDWVIITVAEVKEIDIVE
jgi:hypothetical protein